MTSLKRYIFNRTSRLGNNHKYSETRINKVLILLSFQSVTVQQEKKTMIIEGISAQGPINPLHVFTSASCPKVKEYNFL
jgi:hypothetical protein